ncbi:T9SS type A sorting domain-containing protein [candidate division KSB1 bacterium]|nr:T9SS type A sorting domain-containing protein [candidate division KSB1 bacterium]
MKHLLIMLCALVLSPCLADDIVQIGSSQLMVATGSNNARKIARTKNDFRIVVYEDAIDDLHTIHMTYSEDGLDWAEPLFIDYGLSPCIAVSDGDSFYMSYAKSNESIMKVMVFAPNDLPGLVNAREIDIYYGAPGARHAFPVLDVGSQFVHFAFESRDVNANKSVIRYGLFHRDLQPATPIYTVSDPDANASRPTLQADLEYSSDYINLFWNEAKENDNGIHHLSLDAAKLFASQPTSQQDFWQRLERDFAHINNSFQEFADCTNPSISIRTQTSDNGVMSSYVNHIILGCDNSRQSTFKLYSMDYSTDDQNVDIRAGFTRAASPPAWLSIDDVILNPRSCAIVWEDGGDIYYGQSHYSDIEMEPLNISLLGASHYPSVCYKTFRRDFFDVVWTQGQMPPFKICYRRLPKIYWFASVQIVAESFIKADYLNYFNHIINLQGGLNSALSLNLIEGRLPEGLALDRDVQDEFTWRIHGTPTKSGVYPLTLAAADRGDDVGLVAEHAMTIEIHNSAPTISISPDSLWKSGDTIQYSIALSDSENNNFTWDVERLPGWLTLHRDAMLIKGIGPSQGGVARFFVWANDQELSDTVSVLVIVNTPTDVKIESKPTELTLYPAFPNPFNASTVIKLAVPGRQQIKIDVYDIRGRVVAALHDGLLDAGLHQFTFTATGASGTFFIRMRAPAMVQTQKCILLR